MIVERLVGQPHDPRRISSRTFEIFERTESVYQKLVGTTSGRIEPVPGCAGLVVNVDALWTELARVPE